MAQHTFNIRKSDANPRWWLIHRPTGARIAQAPSRHAARTLRDTLERAWAGWLTLNIQTVTKSAFRKARRIRNEALRTMGAKIRKGAPK